MYWSFQRKLATIICLISLGICLAIYFAVRTSFTEGFFAYLTAARHDDASQMVNAIEQSISSKEEWQRFTRTPRGFHDIYRSSVQTQSFKQSDQGNLYQDRPEKNRPEHFRPDPNKHDMDRRERDKPDRPRPRMRPPPSTPFALLDANQKAYFMHERYEADWAKLPIRLDQELIAHIAIAPIRDNTSVADKQFIESQNRWFRIIAVLSAIVFTLLAWPASAFLMRPLKRLSTAVEQLAKRDYSVRVDLNSGDDIGKLANAFNRMAQELGEFDQRQRNWIADISHELRTPLAVLQAEIEAIQDGVREASPAVISSLKSETLQLRQLVDDLHAIVMNESGGAYLYREPVDLYQLIEQQQELHTQALTEKSLAFTISYTSAVGNSSLSSDDLLECQLLVDRSKITQVIDNLLQNSIRYTDNNGVIACVLREHIDQNNERHIELVWQDSSPGVDQKHLSKLFDRLYRVESSRNRAAGGSGLGLSVCKAIIENHQGSITASASSLGGLKMTILLPCVANEK